MLATAALKTGHVHLGMFTRTVTEEDKQPLGIHDFENCSQIGSYVSLLVSAHAWPMLVSFS